MAPPPGGGARPEVIGLVRMAATGPDDDGLEVHWRSDGVPEALVVSLGEDDGRTGRLIGVCPGRFPARAALRRWSIGTRGQ